MIGAKPVKRGCGRRQKGGVYLETGFSPTGRPLEHFLIDPPILVTDEMMHDMGISPQGVSLFQDPSTEVWHVINWIGATHYPYFGDFYYEGKRFGFSTRAPITTQFELLSRRSEIVHVHPKGHLANWRDYVLPATPHRCPQYLDLHEPRVLLAESPDERTCIGLLDHAVDAGALYGEAHPDLPKTAFHARHTERERPSFTWGTRYYDEHDKTTRPEYPAHDVFRSPDDVEPGWRPAMVLRLPISRAVLVAGDEKHGEKYRDLEERLGGRILLSVEEE